MSKDVISKEARELMRFAESIGAKNCRWGTCTKHRFITGTFGGVPFKHMVSESIGGRGWKNAKADLRRLKAQAVPK